MPGDRAVAEPPGDSSDPDELRARELLRRFSHQEREDRRRRHRGIWLWAVLLTFLLAVALVVLAGRSVLQRLLDQIPPLDALPGNGG